MILPLILMAEYNAKCKQNNIIWKWATKVQQNDNAGRRDKEWGRGKVFSPFIDFNRWKK